MRRVINHYIVSARHVRVFEAPAPSSMAACDVFSSAARERRSANCSVPVAAVEQLTRLAQTQHLLHAESKIELRGLDPGTNYDIVVVLVDFAVPIHIGRPVIVTNVRTRKCMDTCLAQTAVRTHDCLGSADSVCSVSRPFACPAGFWHRGDGLCVAPRRTQMSYTNASRACGLTGATLASPRVLNQESVLRLGEACSEIDTTCWVGVVSVLHQWQALNLRPSAQAPILVDDEGRFATFRDPLTPDDTLGWDVYRYADIDAGAPQQDGCVAVTRSKTAWNLEVKDCAEQLSFLCSASANMGESVQIRELSCEGSSCVAESAFESAFSTAHQLQATVARWAVSATGNVSMPLSHMFIGGSRVGACGSGQPSASCSFGTFHDCTDDAVRVEVQPGDDVALVAVAGDAVESQACPVAVSVVAELRSAVITLPSPPQFARISAVSGNSTTVSWNWPLLHGGAALESFQIGVGNTGVDLSVSSQNMSLTKLLHGGQAVMVVETRGDVALTASCPLNYVVSMGFSVHMQASRSNRSLSQCALLHNRACDIRRGSCKQDACSEEHGSVGYRMIWAWCQDPSSIPQWLTSSSQQYEFEQDARATNTTLTCSTATAVLTGFTLVRPIRPTQDTPGHANSAECSLQASTSCATGSTTCTRAACPHSSPLSASMTWAVCAPVGVATEGLVITYSHVGTPAPIRCPIPMRTAWGWNMPVGASRGAFEDSALPGLATVACGTGLSQCGPVSPLFHPGLEGIPVMGVTTCVHPSILSPSFEHTLYGTQGTVGEHISVNVTTVSGLSASSEATLLVQAAPPSTPSSPKNLSVDEVSGGMIGMAWDPPTDTGGQPLEGYDVAVELGACSTLVSENTRKRYPVVICADAAEASKAHPSSQSWEQCDTLNGDGDGAIEASRHNWINITRLPTQGNTSRVKLLTPVPHVSSVRLVLSDLAAVASFRVIQAGGINVAADANVWASSGLPLLHPTSILSHETCSSEGCGLPLKLQWEPTAGDNAPWIALDLGGSWTLVEVHVVWGTTGPPTSAFVQVATTMSASLLTHLHRSSGITGVVLGDVSVWNPMLPSSAAHATFPTVVKDRKAVVIETWVQVQVKEQRNTTLAVLGQDRAAVMLTANLALVAVQQSHGSDGNFSVCYVGTSDGIILEERWHHILIEFAANDMKIFVDGTITTVVAQACTSVASSATVPGFLHTHRGGLEPSSAYNVSTGAPVVGGTELHTRVPLVSFVPMMGWYSSQSSLRSKWRSFEVQADVTVQSVDSVATVLLRYVGLHDHLGVSIGSSCRCLSVWQRTLANVTTHAVVLLPPSSFGANETVTLRASVRAANIQVWVGNATVNASFAGTDSRRVVHPVLVGGQARFERVALMDTSPAVWVVPETSTGVAVTVAQFRVYHNVVPSERDALVLSNRAWLNGTRRSAIERRGPRTTSLVLFDGFNSTTANSSWSGSLPLHSPIGTCRIKVNNDTNTTSVMVLGLTSHGWQGHQALMSDSHWMKTNTTPPSHSTFAFLHVRLGFVGMWTAEDEVVILVNGNLRWRGGHIATSSCDELGDGWQEWQGFCYNAGGVSSWQDASSRCKSLNASMVVPQNSAEANMLLTRNVSIWTAMSDRKVPGLFVDEDHTTTSYWPWAINATAGVDSLLRRCVVLSVNGNLVNVDCDSKAVSVCKAPLPGTQCAGDSSGLATAAASISVPLMSSTLRVEVIMKGSNTSLDRLVEQHGAAASSPAFVIVLATASFKTLHSPLTFPSRLFPFTNASVSASNEPRVQVTGLTPHTSYCVRVAARNTEGRGQPSVPFAVSTTAPSPAAAPMDVASRNTTGGATVVVWAPPKETGGGSVTGFTIRMRGVSNDGGDSAFLPPNVADVSLLCSTVVSTHDDVVVHNDYLHVPAWSRCLHLGGLAATSEYQIAIAALTEVGPGIEAVVNTTTYDVSVPTVPRELAVLGRTGGTVSVTWQRPIDTGGISIRQYIVEHSIDQGATHAQEVVVAPPASNFVSFRLSHLLALTQVRVRVAAANLPSCLPPSRWSNALAVNTTVATAPGPPVNVQLESVTGGAATLSWIPNDDSGGDIIQLYEAHVWQLGSTQPFTSYVFPYEHPGTATGQVGGMEADSAYLVSVSAVNSVGESMHSTPVEILTSQPTVPSAPLDARAISRTGGSVSLSWQPPLDTGGTPADIEYKALRLDETFACSTSALSCVVWGLSSNSTYVFIIDARNTIGSSAASATVTVKTGSPSSPNSPLPPTLLLSDTPCSLTSSLDDMCNPSGGSIGLALDAVAYAGGLPVLQRSLEVLDAATQTWTEVFRGEATAFTATGLTPLLSYKWRQRVVTLVGTSDPSSVVTYTTTEASKPSPPRLLASERSTGGQVCLVWTKPKDSGGLIITSYVLYIATSVTTPAECLNSLQDSCRMAATVTPLLLSEGGNGQVSESPAQYRACAASLAPNTPYVFRVGASNGVAFGPLSEPTISSTSQVTPSDVIVSLTTRDIRSSLVLLVWENPIDTGGGKVVSVVLSMDPVRSANLSSQVVIPMPSEGAIPTSALIDGLSPGTTYTFRARLVTQDSLHGLNLQGALSEALVVNTVSEESPGYTSFVSSTVFLHEASDSQQVYSIDVERLGGSSGPLADVVKVHTATYVDATGATHTSENELFVRGLGDPWSPLAANINFESGSTRAQMEIRIVNDTRYQVSEAIVLCLQHLAFPVTGWSDDCMTIHVADDHDAGIVGLRARGAASVVKVAEDGGSVVLEVYRLDQYGDSGNVTAVVSLRTATTAFSAFAGVDFDWARDDSGATVAISLSLGDGQRSAPLVIDIFDDEEYEAADEEFVVELVSVSNGASLAQQAQRAVTVTIIDNLDVSAPHRPLSPTLVAATGGLLQVSLDNVDPINTGGARESIEERFLFRKLGAELIPVAQNGIVTNLQFSTQYSFVVVVRNSKLLSDPSPPLIAVTMRPTPPSAPQNTDLVRATGGYISVEWSSPLDKGGVPIVDYVAHVQLVDATGSPQPESVEEVIVDATTATRLQITTHHGLRLLTATRAAVLLAARNSAGLGTFSSPLFVSTQPTPTRPSSPSIAATAVSSSEITLNIQSPVDLGGVNESGIQFSALVSIAGEGGAVVLGEWRHQQVPILTNLHASTRYTISVVAEHVGLLGVCLPRVKASVQPGSSTLLLEGADGGALNQTAVLMFHTAHAPATVRLGVGSFAPVLNLASNPPAPGELTLANPFPGGDPVVSDQLCIVGDVSSQLVVSTHTPGLPDPCPAPQLLQATGGVLGIGMVGPSATGGTAITGFTLYVRALDDSALVAHVHLDTVLLPFLSPDGVIEVPTQATRVPAEHAQLDVLTVGMYNSSVILSGLPHNSTFFVSAQVSTAASQCATRDENAPFSVVRTLPASRPTVPRRLSVTASAGGASLVWVLPSDRGGLVLNASVVRVAPVSVPVVWTTMLAVEPTTAFVFGLEPATKYLAAVKAVSLAGESDWEEVTFETRTVGPPSSVHGLAAVNVTGGAFHVHWCTPYDDGGTAVFEYTLSWKSTNDLAWSSIVVAEKETSLQARGPFVGDLSICPEINARTVHMAHLSASTTYSVKVVATSFHGPSPVSQISVTTLEPSPPGPPTAVKQTGATGGAVFVQWGYPDDTGGLTMSEYVVEVELKGIPVIEPLVVAAPANTGDPLRAPIYGLNNNFHYNVSIRARNAIGRLGSAAVVRMRTLQLATDPGRITGMRVVSRLGGSLRLAWDAPRDTGGYIITGYAVEFGEVGQTMATLPQAIESTSAHITGLVPDTSYMLRVKAFTAWTQGEFSDLFVTTTGSATVPSPPVVSRVELVGDATAHLHMVEIENGGAPVEEFRVVMADRSGNTSTFSAPQSIVVVDGLESGSQYTITAQAVNAVGASAASVAFDYFHELPSLETQVKASSSTSDSALLQWETPLPKDGVNVTGFQVRDTVGWRGCVCLLQLFPRLWCTTAPPRVSMQLSGRMSRHFESRACFRDAHTQ